MNCDVDAQGGLGRNCIGIACMQKQGASAIDSSNFSCFASERWCKCSIGVLREIVLKVCMLARLCRAAPELEW